MTMPASWVADADERSLGGSMRDYMDPNGPRLLDRTAPFLAWQDRRRKRLLWPLGRSFDSAPRAECDARYDNGSPISGINLASHDHLGLSSHPAIKRAAQRAIRDYGVHSAGSSASMGNSAYTPALERRLADFLRMEHGVLFPSGWAAGYGTLRALVREHDHVVFDERIGSGLKEGAHAATRKLRSVAHLDPAAFRAALVRIRSEDAKGAILVVTEALFPMEADSPDIAALIAVCREYEATLLVDVTHDLGSMGDDGTGVLGIQGLLGDVDLVVGSFSRTFATNGGFLLTRRRSVKEYVKAFASPVTCSSALAPAQAAVAIAALDVVGSTEGQVLRKALYSRVLQLREGLATRGFRCLGTPAPSVPLSIENDALARLLARALPTQGLIADMFEYPETPLGDARLGLQLMATHTPRHIERAIEAMGAAHLQACGEFDRAVHAGVANSAWPYLAPL